MLTTYWTSKPSDKTILHWRERVGKRNPLLYFRFFKRWGRDKNQPSQSGMYWLLTTTLGRCYIILLPKSKSLADLWYCYNVFWLVKGHGPHFAHTNKEFSKLGLLYPLVSTTSKVLSKECPTTTTSKILPTACTMCKTLRIRHYPVIGNDRFVKCHYE